MIKGEQLRNLLYLMKHFSNLRGRKGLFERICAESTYEHADISFMRFSCQRTGQNLAYKHKMTVYLRDRSLEGSFCPTGK